MKFPESYISLEKHGEHGDFMGFHGGFWGEFPWICPWFCGVPCSGPKAVALQLRLWPENSEPANFMGMTWDDDSDDLVQENSKNPAIDMYVLVLYI